MKSAAVIKYVPVTVGFTSKELLIMEKKEYTEQQKADAVKKAEEIGVQAAAKELGIPWQALAQWNKSAGNPTVRGMNKEKKAAKAAKKASVKKSTKTVSKKTPKTAAKSTANTAAKKSTKTAAKASSRAATKTSTKSTSKAATAKTASKKSDKPSALEIRNAVLKSENQELKTQIAKLKKALSNLM